MAAGLPIEIYDGPCLSDLDGNGIVDVTDLLQVINQWGTGVGDVQGDGTTDITDLLSIVDKWGLCN